MSGELSAARSHPAVIVAVVVAAVAVTACALVAIAYMLGWVPSRAAVPTPMGIASPGQQVAGSAPEVGLLPGETLVAPAETPKPGTPQYARPTPPLPQPSPAASQPAAPPAQPAVPAYSKPAPLQPPPARAAPSKPGYVRTEPPPYASYEPSARSFCVNCGTVASVSVSGADWDVRVRFEDGSSETLRYPERPRFRAGERVRLEDGRLVPD